MPRVPVYESRERLAPLPGVTVGPAPGPEAYGADIGRAVSGIGALVQRRVEEMQAEDNAAAVMAAEGMLADWEARTLHDPERGVYVRRGRDALGALPEASSGFDDAAREAQGTLANDAQRRAFQGAVQRRRERAIEGVSRHVARERTAFLDQTAESYILQGQTDAVNNYTDPAALRDARETTLRGVAVWGRAAGRPAEMVQARREEALSAFHKGVVERLALEDPQAAQAYYGANAHEIRGRDHTAIEAGLKGAVSSQRAEALAASVYLPDEPLTAIEAAIRAGDHGQEVKDAAIRRVRDRRTVDEHETRRRDDETTREAWRVVEATKSTDGLTLEQRRVVAGPTLDSMERRAATLRAGAEPTHDPVAWAQFRAMPPEEVLALDIPTQYINRFSRGHYDRAIEIQQAYRAASSQVDVDPKLTAALSFDDRVLRTARDAGLVPMREARGKWKDGQAEAFDAFEREAALKVRNYEATQLGGKRKATEEEVQAVLDGIVADRLRTRARQDKPWARDPTVDLSQVTEDDLGRVYVPMKSIPRSEAQALREEFAARGTPKPKEREIERAYAAALAGNRKLLLEILERRP